MTATGATAVAILCGGQGTRLAARLPNTPKFLAPIGGLPFAEHLLGWLSAWGFRHVVLCTGSGADAIRDACGTGERWGLRLDYSREREPLGTGGALVSSLPFIGTDHVLVLNGDTFLGFDPARLLATAPSTVTATLVVVQQQDRSRYGAVEVDAEWRVRRFLEKGASGPGLISGGACLLRRSHLASFPPHTPRSLERDILAPLAPAQLAAFLADGPFIDFGVPADYDRAAAAAPSLPLPAR